jgi:hypothetical protein
MDTMRVIDRHTRTITIVFFGEVLWLLLIGIVHVHNAVPKASLAVSSSLVLALAIRAGYSHVLVLESGRLTTRTLLRTRSWNYDELRWAEEAPGRTKGANRCFIVLKPKTGKSYSFEGFGEEPDSPMLTARTVREINARIRSSDTTS